MYCVVYYKSDVGSRLLKQSRIFNKEAKAWEYCSKLNKEIAKERGCEVTDLSGFFITIRIKEGV